jgi:predicted MPP superfamily phosphohydrolase
VVQECGIDLLRNEHRTIDGLTFVGLDDLWSKNWSAAKAFATAPGGATIALCHNPDGVDQGGWGNYSGWVLSGHTHGGQCKPPFLPPPICPVKNKRYVAGEYDIGRGRRLYINRGLGHIVQARFNARPEITVFRLTRS